MPELALVTPISGGRSTTSVDDRVLRGALLRHMRVRTRGCPDAEDLVHEVLLRVWNREATDTIDNLSAYAFQTAASVLADRHRRRRNRQAQDHVEFDADRHAACDLDAGRILEGRETLRAAEAILDRLPTRTQEAFVLRRLDGAPCKEVAARLGMSVSSVEKHMVRAARKLAHCARGGTRH